MYEQAFGRIVDISGVHGMRASPFKSAYVAAKHRLEGLANFVALEGGTPGRSAVLRLPTDATVPATYRPSTKVHGLIQWNASAPWRVLPSTGFHHDHRLGRRVDFDGRVRWHHGE